MNSLWNLVQNEYNSAENRKYETIFTLANGYRGIRGSLNFSSSGENGNFIAGVFDKSDAQVTEIVNCPNPLCFGIYLDNEKIDIDKCRVIKFKRYLDMETGILYLETELETNSKKTVIIKSERYVSRNNVHRWAEKYEISVLNFKGSIFIENIIDGTTVNSANDPVNMIKHYRVIQDFDLGPGIGLSVLMHDKKTEIVEAAVLKSESEGLFKERKYGKFGEKVRELYRINSIDGKFTVYKFGCTYTSRDVDNPADFAKKDIDDFITDGYEFEKKLHINIWKKIWNNADIKIDGDDRAQIGIRYNIYQLASCAYDKDKRISIAAKGLHGEGYKGHVFWDTETFMLPFFIYTMPDVAKSLLMYRYNTLSGARKNAKMKGFIGAQFPWESADEGIEVTPKHGIDFDGTPIRIWTGDEEYHINSDINFAIYEYYRATMDRDFLINYGMEIYLETAKFWESRVEYNRELDRYEINRVIGPDEFHEHINNNFYTNYFVKWSLEKTFEFAEWLKRENNEAYKTLCRKLGINEDNFEKWKEIIKKLYIPMKKDGKLIEQFEGYFKLKDIKITNYDHNGMPEWPVLNGLKLSETQLIKQPDVIMLLLMLREEFDIDTLKENYSYYEQRTMHKSSLSPSMYSIMGMSVGDRKDAYRYFIKAIMTDIEDNQGNTGNGLHAASTGGSWQSAVFGFGGLSIDKKMMLNINPWIPENWEKLSYNILWRGSKITIDVTKNEVVVTAQDDIKVKVYGKLYNLRKNISTYIKR